MSRSNNQVSSAGGDQGRLPRCPSRGRVLLASFLGTGMLSAIYVAFPPIFADDDPAPRPVVAEKPAGPLDFQELPEIAMTPSIEAHRKSIDLLEEGVRRLRDIPVYTATFVKEEMVRGERTAPQTMRLKMRHDPFSVYLKWTDGLPGQELLYVQGQNDGKMIVRAGGFKGILGAIKIDVDGTMAMKQARHPVTELGLIRLAESVLEYRYKEADWTDGYTCVEKTGRVDGRPCFMFVTTYDGPQWCPDYRKSKIWIDKEYLAITKICNFGWPDDDQTANRDESRRLEEYTYTNLNFRPDLVAQDFSAANSDYRLRRR